MKKGIWGRVLIGVAALCLVASAAAAASKGGHAFVGEWDLDVAKSTVNGQAAFKSGHVSITGAKGVYKSVVDFVPASGAAIHYEHSFSFDGSSSPVTGSTYFDSATMLEPDRNTAIRTERRGGKVVGSTTIEVSKDGKVLSSSSKGTGLDGKPFVRALTWTRAKTKK